MIVDSKNAEGIEGLKLFDSFRLALLFWYTDACNRCSDDGQRSSVKDELEYIIKTFNTLTNK